MTMPKTNKYHNVLAAALCGLMVGLGATPAVAADAAEAGESCHQVCPLPAHLLAPETPRSDPAGIPLPAEGEAGAPGRWVVPSEGASGLPVVVVSTVR